MNKVLLTLLMILLAAGLAAQTGLFSLSFGDSKSDAIDNLTGQGFSVYENNDDTLVMTPDDNYKVDSIHMDFTDDALTGWIIYYTLEDDDIEDQVLDALEYWHGDEYYWDDDMEEWYWYLDDYAMVYAGYDWSGDYYYAEYNSD